MHIEAGACHTDGHRKQRQESGAVCTKKVRGKGGQIDYQFVLVGKVGKNEVTFYTKNALFWTKKVL